MKLINKISIASFLPGIQDILFIAIFSAALLLGPVMLNMDGDLPKHLAIGKYVLSGHFPPVNDIFSHTRYGVPFAPHKWLSGVLFYLSYLVFNEKGIVILSATLLAATFAVIYNDSVSHTQLRLPTLFLIAFGAAVSSLHWIARPHLFTMFMIAVWLVWNEKLASGKKIPLLYFPVGMFLWNNLHGEFISGFLITIAYLAGWIWDYIFDRAETQLELGKKLGAVLGMITFVTLLNPISFRAWGTVLNWMGNQYLMENTQETIPPNFLDADFYILLAFIAFSIFQLTIKQERLPARHGFILAGFTILTLLSARNLHIYGVVAPFILARTLKRRQASVILQGYEDLLKRFDNRNRMLFWPIVTILAGVLFLQSSPLGTVQRFSPGYFPVQAVEWLEQNPQQGEMFNPFDWGGYIALKLWPENRVFIDSQGDVYGEAFIREYEQLISLKTGWQDVLQKYHIEWAMVPQPWPLAAAMKNEGWITIYEDPTAIILRRNE